MDAEHDRRATLGRIVVRAHRTVKPTRAVGHTTQPHTNATQAANVTD